MHAYVSIKTPCGRRGGDKFVVCFTHNDDPTWTQYVMEVAEFTTRADADQLMQSLVSLFRMSKPKQSFVQLTG
jgi:hypothetical protein